MPPFISIYIPAYKNISYLKTLLDSIEMQSWKSYEVIISDDSPDMEVEELVKKYENRLTAIQYIHNQPANGMPANWNYAKKLCKGEWLKIMHDDDWFSDKDSLKIFAEVAQKTAAKFIFSAYQNVQLTNNKHSNTICLDSIWKKRIEEEPLTLMSSNKIGPPSVVLVHKSVEDDFDIRLRWRVDLDYYIRILQKNSFEYINKLLIYIGISDTQITQSVKYVKSVELPEAYIILEKYGTLSLNNMIVFDSWWRLFRNLEIRNVKDLDAFVPSKNWPNVIQKMIQQEGRVPTKILAMGIFSKITMTISYLYLIRIKKLERKWK